MEVTPPNFATNRARKCSKVLRLATLNFVENFSPASLHTAAVFHEEVRVGALIRWLFRLLLYRVTTSVT
jgi:hypothetical protein